MGLFFDDPKPRVTKDEFKKVRSALSVRGLTHKEIDDVEKIFQADLYESASTERGINSTEIDRGIQWLKAHSHSHTFTPAQIDIIDQELRKKL